LIYVNGIEENEEKSTTDHLFTQEKADNLFTTDHLRDRIKKDDNDDICIRQTKTKKCLIFAQFTRSLDVVENILFKPHMPSLLYKRLDGNMSLKERQDAVEQFRNNNQIKALLLTTKIGGLGLNLSNSDIVVMLEHDWNPHSDLQAMDRAHRIGQDKTVNVYRLITKDTIEEKIMQLQERKLAMSNAIINTENSCLYSMGTDRLLDIFDFQCEIQKENKQSATDKYCLDFIDDICSEDEYSGLSLTSFLEWYK